MYKVQNSDQILNFWIIKTVKGGFLIGSDICPAFILEDCDFIDYLLKVDQIGADDYCEITYKDFLRGDALDIQNHIDNYLSEKRRKLVEEYNRSKLTVIVPPFPAFDAYESNEGHQRPTFSRHKIHIKTK
jgi:hypothetical protein